MLTHWQVEPDLAGIRDLKALDEASAEERNDCFALWDEVGAVLRRIAVQERAIVLDPKRADPRRAVPTELMRQGRLEEARVAWRTALRGQSAGSQRLVRVCRVVPVPRPGGRVPPRTAGLAREVLHHRQSVLRGTHRPGLSAHARDGRGAAPGRCPHPARRGVRPIEGLTRNYPWFLFARGLAEYREGKFDQAIATMRGDASRVGGPDRPPRPRHGPAPGWTVGGGPENARGGDPLLRLEGDSGARPQCLDLPCAPSRGRGPDSPEAAGLSCDGRHRPQDNDERLALLAGKLAKRSPLRNPCAMLSTVAKPPSTLPVSCWSPAPLRPRWWK